MKAPHGDYFDAQTKYMMDFITVKLMEDCSMIQLKFRKAAEEDAPGLLKLFKETLMDVYGQILPIDMLKPWIEGERLSADVDKLWPYMVVAEKAGEIVAAAARIEDLVALLWVHPAHHRRGIGSNLLDIVETDLMMSGHETARLECFSDNHQAMGFYRAKGWEPLREEMDKEVGVLKVVMTKNLPKMGR
jgi:ribosomal protein S18 acetylase RimI-like enzyme